MKSKDVLAGLVGGLAVGAILGILFAPEKGEVTRRKIAKKSNKLKNEVQDSYKDLLSTIENKYNDLTSKTEKIEEVK